ncbi:hypothetical protein, partial [Burkholderia pseudomallei]|uniref:hypothetical protein n=1 Tax=Burkholderia pseudomallei TaxID=28450 RepID=UPI00211604DE
MLLPRFGGRTMLVTSTADRRPPTADRRPPITDHRSPITDHRSPITAARAPPSEPSGPNKTAARERGRQIADKPSPSGGFLFFNGVMLKTPMP